MRIAIWYTFTDGPWGGGNQFLRALGKHLTMLGCEVIDRPERSCSILLVNAHTRGQAGHLTRGMVAEVRARGESTLAGRVLPPWVWRRSRPGQVVVHRLDGVPADLRGRRTAADRLQFAVNKATDVTVFQSSHSRRRFAEMGLAPSRSTIIGNGADPDIFYPSGRYPPLKGPLRVAATSWSPNPRKGFATLAALSRLPGVEVTFMGRWAASIPSEGVRLLPAGRSERVAEVLRNSHAFVHASEMEGYSNSIVEAIACGLPVLYRDSGPNAETVGACGRPLSGDIAADLAALRDRLAGLRERALESRPGYLIPSIARDYLRLFEAALQEAGR